MDSKLRDVAKSIAGRYQQATAASLERVALKSPVMAEMVSEVSEVVRTSVLLALNEFAVECASRLLGEQYDETPTNVNADPVAIARDAGYRAGHNHAQRNAASMLTGKAVVVAAVEVKRNAGT